MSNIDFLIADVIKFFQMQKYSSYKGVQQIFKKKYLAPGLRVQLVLNRNWRKDGGQQ